MSGRVLLLKKVVESAPSVTRPVAAATSTAHTASGITGFAINGRPRHKKLAGIADILLGNALRDGFGALKLRTRIEITAILAGPQVRTAFGTLAFG